MKKKYQIFIGCQRISTKLQANEDFLVLLQNRVKNLTAELAPLSLGDLSGLELAEHDVVFVLHEKKVSGFLWVSKIFLDFFPVAVRRCLVLAPTTAAVVATRQSLEVKVFQRSRFVLLEVRQNHLSRNFRLENVAMLCLHARVFEVRGADLVQAESAFFLVDGLWVVAALDLRDSIEKSVEIGSRDRKRDE